MLTGRGERRPFHLITERYRRVNYGRLTIEVTVNDPKAYTKPWTVTLNQTILPDTDLLEYHCNDN